MLPARHHLRARHETSSTVQMSHHKPLSLRVVLQWVLQLTGTELLSTRVCPDPWGEGEPGSASALCFLSCIQLQQGWLSPGVSLPALLPAARAGGALPVLVLPAWGSCCRAPSRAVQSQEQERPKRQQPTQLWVIAGEPEH